MVLRAPILWDNSSAAGLVVDDVVVRFLFHSTHPPILDTVVQVEQDVKVDQVIGGGGIVGRCP